MELSRRLLAAFLCALCAFARENPDWRAEAQRSQRKQKTPEARQIIIRRNSQRGATLIEMIVYMALFAVVVGSAFTTFYECWDNNRALGRNADDITRALSLGERWRGDIRAATGPIQQTSANGIVQLHIPAATGEIVYTISDSQVRRQPASAAPASLWLANVKSSQIESQSRGPVTAWRWELELKTERREARFKPLFTFETAAATAITR